MSLFEISKQFARETVLKLSSTYLFEKKFSKTKYIESECGINLNDKHLQSTMLIETTSSTRTTNQF